MPEISKNNFFFLNRDSDWPGFKKSGIELREDGALQLSSLPRALSALPDAVKSASVPSGPAGLAIDATGTLFFTDPDSNKVSRILSCDSSVCPAPCMGGNNGGPTGLNAPRGLVLPPTRQSLFVMDSGNHCIKIFTLDTFQLAGIWGQPNLGGTPQPSSQPGQFNTPWTAAADSGGNLYVVDYGNQRVQKFNSLGDVIPAFCDNVQASALLQQPADIAIREKEGQIWILVVDASSSTICVFDPNGQPVRDSSGNPKRLQDSHLTQPMGSAADRDSLYVGDNGTKRVLRFQIEDTFEYVGT
ncbi:MAG TPA: NHL repeat-containing protein, partial [Terriglobales bacterium]